jgi:hypothetical protein
MEISYLRYLVHVEVQKYWYFTLYYSNFETKSTVRKVTRTLNDNPLSDYVDVSEKEPILKLYVNKKSLKVVHWVKGFYNATELNQYNAFNQFGKLSYSYHFYINNK